MRASLSSCLHCQGNRGGPRPQAIARTPPVRVATLPGEPSHLGQRLAQHPGQVALVRPFTQARSRSGRPRCPTSAASRASGSAPPRSRSPCASASARRAILISSRSRSSALAAMTAWRRRECARLPPNNPAAASRAAATASSGPALAGAAASAVDHLLLEDLGAGEQHLPLVGEVPEEGARRHPRPLGDLGHGRLLEALLDVQVQRRRAQPAGGVRLPATHGCMIGDDTV